MYDSKELKNRLGIQAKEIILQGLNLKEVKGKISCPLHADKNPSMSWFNEGLMFKCHSCNENIDIFRYYTYFEKISFNEALIKVAELTNSVEKTNNIVKEKTFVFPNISTQELSEKAINLMQSRKINKSTLEAWKVKESIFCNKPVYVFQYFNDKNILEYVSYREILKGGSKGGCEKNTKSILWGMWHIDKSVPLVITEGQPDAMAIWQSGYKNVVSVPSGANNFTWINNCWEWLQDIKEIIVFADNDKAGLQFADEVKRRLKNVKVLVSERKDANEVLFYDGENKVLELITDTINKMPNGLIDLAKVDYKSVLETRHTGIETGFYDYDKHIEDWKEQEITILVGRNGEGKTTFISQVLAHCLEKKVKTFLYSGEMSQNKIQNWLYRQLVGNKNEFTYKVETKYKIKTEIRPEIIERLKIWHNETLYLFDRESGEVASDINKFFELMELATKRYGVKLFIIDNLMSKLEEKADSLNSDQANFVQKCKDFVIKNKCHLVLLVHPNKLKTEIKDNSPANIEKTDISGTNNIANKADNIISIERNWSDNRDYDMVLTSLKDRESGDRKAIKYNFSKDTLRFYNNNTPAEKIYSWENIKDEQVRLQLEGEELCPF